MRPLGKNIVEVCAALEKIGPCGYAVVADHLGAKRADVSTYLKRAVERGLVDVDKPNGRGRRDNFGIYSVDPGWRDMAGMKPKEAKAAKVVRFVAIPGQRARKVGMFSYASSIFSVGAA